MLYKISIVTVCLNSADTLADTLTSVAAQDYKNIEHLVQDGGSTDGTEGLVRNINRGHIRYLSRRDRGTYDAMNAALQRAEGDIVGFLNADDYLADPSVITRMVRTFEKSSADIVYGDIDIVDPANTERIIRKWTSGVFRPGRFRDGWHPPHPAFYARRAVLDEAGGFDLAFSISADYALMMKLMEIMRCSVAYEPSVWVKMRAGGNSNGTLRNIVKANLECRTAMIKLGIDPPMAFPMSKLWMKVRQRFVLRKKTP